MGKALEGKIALVTGGSAGIGLASARAFIAERATVYITGRRQAALDEAVALLGPSAIGVRADAGNVDDIDMIVSRIADGHGRLDVLYSNAGVYGFGALGQITAAHYDDHFDANVRGVVFLMQAALPILSRNASVVLTGSVVAHKGIENFSVYSATKAAVTSLARSWTAELKDRGIRVNVISPGPIDTPGLDGLAGGKANVGELKRGLTTMVPLGRMGLAGEVARAAVFLASDASSYVAGAELAVDGGAGAL